MPGSNAKLDGYAKQFAQVQIIGCRTESELKWKTVEEFMPVSNITVEPADGVGAYIRNIDLADGADNDAINKITQALGEYGVVFFRDQKLTPQQHVTFAEKFGSININRFFTPVDSHPKIAEVKKEPTDEKNIGSAWHTDHSYDSAPALGSVLLAREIPPTGGDTIFANMFAAYDNLSEGLKTTLQTLVGVHSSEHVFGAKANRGEQFSRRLGNAELATQTSTHPIVIQHPISGKKALYVNPGFTIGIESWRKEESKPLLDMLYAHAVQPEFTHRFKWHRGSMAFWDNRATWHRALNDYSGYLRLMHRITVEGVNLS